MNFIQKKRGEKEKFKLRVVKMLDWRKSKWTFEPYPLLLFTAWLQPYNVHVLKM